MNEHCAQRRENITGIEVRNAAMGVRKFRNRRAAEVWTREPLLRSGTCRRSDRELCYARMKLTAWAILYGDGSKPILVPHRRKFGS